MLTAALADKTEEELSPWASELLVQLEQNLDGDVGLESLAGAWGASPFKFHRLFSSAVGETPKQRVLRMRLERAAQLLAASDQRVLDIGLAVGFNSHEAFTRAFKRSFGQTPTAYRAQLQAIRAARAERNHAFRGWCCELSEVRFEHRQAINLIAIRQFGAYAGFSPKTREKIWRELRHWAQTQDLDVRADQIGLYPDDPMLTPGPQQSSELCVPVNTSVGGDSRVRPLLIEGGLFAIVDHFGPYETLIQAHRTVQDAIRRLDQFELRQGAPVQVFLTVAEGGNPSANRTQVWLPIQMRR